MKRIIFTGLMSVILIAESGALSQAQVPSVPASKKKGYLQGGPVIDDRYSYRNKSFNSARVVQLEMELTDIKQELDISKKQVAELKKKLASVKSERNTLQEKLAEVEAEKAVLTQEYERALRSVDSPDQITNEDTHRLYVVKEGDTLWNIAGKRHIYDDPFRWIDIYNANKEDLDKTNKELMPGMYLRIPRDAITVVSDKATNQEEQ